AIEFIPLPKLASTSANNKNIVLRDACYPLRTSHKEEKMSLLVIGSVAFDALETPFGKREKIIGGAGTFISLSAANFVQPVNLVSVVGGDFLKSDIEMMQGKGINT